MQMPNTNNNTSFAVAYGDATVLVLDALVAGGGKGKELLRDAQRRLNTANDFAGSAEELALSNGLLNTVTELEKSLA